MKATAFVVFLVGCTGDFGFVPDEKILPAEPPGTDSDTKGSPPDWNSCFQGWRGVYYNLRVTDDYVAPRPKDPPAPTEPEGFDYWDQPEAFEAFDASLDFGQNWWPVDQGLEGDPKYFAVHWDAWIRGDGGDFQFTLGSQDDSWVYVNGAPIASKPGIQPFCATPSARTSAAARPRSTSGSSTAARRRARSASGPSAAT